MKVSGTTILQIELSLDVIKWLHRISQNPLHTTPENEPLDDGRARFEITDLKHLRLG